MKPSALALEEELMADEPVDDENCALNREELERLVEEHLRSDDAQTAAFWAEKLLAIDRGKSLNERLPQIAHYLSVLTAARSWQTIISLVDRHDLFSKHLAFVFFDVNALFNRELFSDIIALPIGHLCSWNGVPCLHLENATYICAESGSVREPAIKARLDEFVRERKYEARLLFLLAKTYLMVQNRPAAASCLRHCLASNPHCSEALHLAIDGRLLKPTELEGIITGSPEAARNASGSRVISQLLDIYDLNSELDPATLAGQRSCQLGLVHAHDLSFQSAYAFRMYSQGCIQEAYRITSTIMHEFGHYSKCFLVHIACLVHLAKSSELYQLGHSMVKLQPEREITWYTVGAYYYATGQYTTAKKFLNKCTIMNSGFGEGWLAYGHTLYYVEEHEQSMNCYLRASRILEGHFEPLLYIAMEYCHANNFKLATDFLHDAETVAGANAVVLNEQGNVAFMEHDFKKAEGHFLEALQLVTHRNPSDPLEVLLSSEISSDFWEPLFNNLGHTLRKLGKHDKAILVHRKSLLLGTAKAEAWACIGVCYAHLVADCHAPNNKSCTPQQQSASISAHLDSAIEAFNKSLALKPGVGDEQVKSALDKVMQFASDRHQHEPFPADVAAPTDENFDMVVEGYKRQGGTKYQQRRCRRTLAGSSGLDKLDPNTGGGGEGIEAASSATIGRPTSCSSPMMETRQQRAAMILGSRASTTTGEAATAGAGPSLLFAPSPLSNVLP